MRVRVHVAINHYRVQPMVKLTLLPKNTETSLCTHEARRAGGREGAKERGREISDQKDHFIEGIDLLS